MIPKTTLDEVTPGPWYARKMEDGKINVYTELGLHSLAKFKSYGDAVLVVRMRNLHDELVSNLLHEHEEAVGEEHFDKVSSGEIGCSVCSLINKAGAKP